MKRNYEMTVIFSPQLSETKLSKTQKSVLALIEKGKGKVKKKEDWGTKILATPIKKETEGIYQHLVIEIPPESIGEIRKQIRLIDGVMRYLFVLVEKKKL